MSEIREYKRKRAALAAYFHKEVLRRNLQPDTPEYDRLAQTYDDKWQAYYRRISNGNRRIAPRPDAFKNFINLCK